MTRCFVVYDIPDDRIRKRISDLCLDYGLDRIQYSAFTGVLNNLHRRELFVRMRRQIGKNAARICLFAIRDEDWQRRDEVTQGDGETTGNRA